MEQEVGSQILLFVRMFYGGHSTYLWEDDVGIVHHVEQGEGGEQADVLISFSPWASTGPCKPRKSSHWRVSDCSVSWTIFTSSPHQNESATCTRCFMCISSDTLPSRSTVAKFECGTQQANVLAGDLLKRRNFGRSGGGGSGGRCPAEGGPNQQPHQKHEPQPQQQTPHEPQQHTTTNNNTQQHTKQTTTQQHRTTHSNSKNHTNHTTQTTQTHTHTQPHTQPHNTQHTTTHNHTTPHNNTQQQQHKQVKKQPTQNTNPHQNQPQHNTRKRIGQNSIGQSRPQPV